jgi:hypothetical protein
MLGIYGRLSVSQTLSVDQDFDFESIFRNSGYFEPYYSVCFNDIAKVGAKHHRSSTEDVFYNQRRTQAEQLSACSDNLSRIILEHQHFDWAERSIISLPVISISHPWVSVVSFARIRTGLLEHRDDTP